MRVRVLLSMLLWLLLAGSALAARDKLPGWLKSAMEKDNEVLWEDFNAMGLYHYGKYTIDRRGSINYTFRYAVRIKTRDERERARAAVYLQGKDEKVRSFRAYLVFPSGKVETFKEKDLIDIADEMDSLYSEAKMRVMDRSGSVLDGVVFAYEYTKSEKTIFPIYEWYFQSDLPRINSKITIEIPSDWEVRVFSSNTTELPFTRRDNEYTWEMENLTGIRDEPNSLARERTYKKIGINIIPSEKDSKKIKFREFRNWNDVAVYADKVQKNSIAATGPVAKKARELALGKNSEWEKISAVCNYAQSVNYVSISLNLNKGGGYKPRKAEEVLSKHYGDCKDMTAFARALLHSLGMEAYAVLAKVGPDAWVHENWPSPTQFNHCILGIPVSEVSGNRPAIINHPDLGNLLIFDPTMKDTPVGDLPYTLEGTRILVGSENTMDLTLLPDADQTMDRLERTTQLTIDEEGTLTGSIKEASFGNMADYNRSIYKDNTPEEYQKLIRLWISRSSGDAELKNLEVEDTLEENLFELNVEFTISKFARIIGDELMVFKPVVLGQHTWVPPEDEERHNDYKTTSWSIIEDVKVTFPDTFRVENCIGDVELKSEFGSYSMKTNYVENEFSIKRKIESYLCILPVDKYQEIVEYYRDKERKETAPVVLKKL